MGEIIRKTKNGKFLGWYLRYIDADGKRKQRASKQATQAEARRMLVEIEARIVRGMVGIEERRCDMTLAELIERFTREYANPKVKHLACYQERAKYVLQRVHREAPQVYGLNLSAITAAHIVKVRDALGRRYPAGTVRATLTFLQTVFSWAVRQGLTEKNVMKGVQRPPAPPVRPDFLSSDEVRRLLTEVERRAREARGATHLSWWSRWMAITIGIHTGLRKGEIFGLRWNAVDLDGQRLTICHSYDTTPKNGKTRFLCLPSVLVPLLREWRALCPSDFVCPVLKLGKWGMSRNPANEHMLPRLYRASGCRVLTRPWHLLRHSFASHFMQNGGSLLALSQILGHTDVKVTMIYAHLSPEFMADQIEKVRF